MLSRVACNVYWMSRYLERAEDTARLISVQANLLLDLPLRGSVFGWDTLIAIISSEEAFAAGYRSAGETNVIRYLITEEAFAAGYRSAGETNVIRYLITDEDNPGSILSSLRQARENLRTTRELIPREAWEELNDLYLTAVETAPEVLSRRTRFDYLKRIVRGCQLISGLLAGTMNHGTAFQFLRLGGYLERADMTTRIVDVRAAGLLPRRADVPALSPLDNIQWMSVLKSLTAYQMYRQQVRLRVQGPDVLAFLLRDRDFPRAVGFCLSRIALGLRLLPHHEAPLARIEALEKQLGAADVKALVRGGLHEFIDELQVGLGELHDAIDLTYFNPPAVQRQAG